jgi:hypothetical protein
MDGGTNRANETATARANDAAALDPANVFSMRPVYDFVCEGEPEDFVSRLAALASFDPAVQLIWRPRHAVLSIPTEISHTWSPVLDVTALDHGERCHVHARLGPSPEVWTFLMFLAAAGAIPSFFLAMYGLSQASIGGSGWGLIGLPIAVLWLAGIYSTSLIGRRLGAKQIHQLLAVLEANLLVSDEFIDDRRALSRPAQSGTA